MCQNDGRVAEQTHSGPLARDNCAYMTPPEQKCSMGRNHHGTLHGTAHGSPGRETVVPTKGALVTAFRG